MTLLQDVFRTQPRMQLKSAPWAFIRGLDTKLGVTTGYAALTKVTW
jgi:hypothetical protein